MKKTFNITVSVKEGASRSVLRGIIQYDTLNEVNIRLSDGSKAFNYDGYTNIIFKVLKADGTAYIDSEGENMIATSPVDGIVTINLSGQATTAVGLCQSVIEVYSGDGKMTTARFNYEVFEALDVDDAVESESQYPVFQNLMADISALEASIEEAEAKRVAVEAGRVTSEEQRVVAEAQRVEAEKARSDEANGYVTQAELAKNSASVSAAVAESWARQAKSIAGGNFAPDGYGLGEEPPFVEDLNDAVVNGWYKAIGNTTKNYPALITGLGGAYGVLFVQTRGYYKYQELRYKNEVAVRYFDGTAWSEWEYVNPPMALGVEYRTTERRAGKPLYVKWVSLGTLATGMKSIEHGIADIQYVWAYQGLRGNMAMPMTYNNSLSDDWTCYITNVNHTVVSVYSGASASGASAGCILWYTKTSDT